VQIKNYLRQTAGGGEVKTNKTVWYRLMQFAGDNPAAFADEDLLKYADSLSTQDFEEGTALQQKIRENVRNGDAIQTDNQLVTGALRQLGIKTAGKISDKDTERAQNFRYEFQRSVNDEFRRTGKQPSIQDKQGMVDRLTMEVVTKRGVFSDSTAPLFEASQVIDVKVPGTDEKVILAAIRANPAMAQAKMRANGLQSEDDLVRFMYLLGKGLVSQEPVYDSGGPQSR
jgi:hypothetical protein